MPLCTILSIQCRLIETPFADQFCLDFKENQVIMTSKVNVGFEKPK